MLESPSLSDKTIITSLIFLKNFLWLEVADNEVNNFQQYNMKIVSYGEVALSLQRHGWVLNQEYNFNRGRKPRLNFSHHLIENLLTNLEEEKPSHNGSAEKVYDEMQVIPKTAQNYNIDLYQGQVVFSIKLLNAFEEKSENISKIGPTIWNHWINQLGKLSEISFLNHINPVCWKVQQTWS